MSKNIEKGSSENIMNLSKGLCDKELFSKERRFYENTMNLSKGLCDKELFSENTVIFKTYILNDNNESIEDREYIFKLTERIIDIKNKILKDSFKNKYNNLEMTNITQKVYKDYGKLFFDKGLLPLTINNYKLSEFTNEGRIFSFIVKGSNIQIEKNIKKESDFIKKIIKEDRKKSSDFMIYDDDFPPLPSTRK